MSAPSLLDGSRRISVDLPGRAMRLSAHDIGDGPPLVLIMGLGAAGDAWEPHVRAWNRGFRCLAVDNRGAGASSSPPGPWTTRDMADDYAALISALGLGPLTVVGLSMGGAVAQELALAHPHLVARLVLVSTWARCDPYLADLFTQIAQVREQAAAETFAAMVQLLIWSRSWWAAHRLELQADRARAVPPVAARALAAQAAACARHDALARLPGITVPTLVTAGSEDVFTPPPLAAEVAAAIPGSRLEIFRGAGHAHHWEALDAFNTLVEEWAR